MVIRIARSAPPLAVAAALAAFTFAAPAHAQKTVTSVDGRWTASQEIIGQTSTATVAGGGNPIYIPPRPQYSGVVGLLMDFGAQGAFVCSGSLIGRDTILTAAHCVSGGAGTPGPLSTTAFFYGGPDDPALYAGGAGIVQIGVSQITVNPGYTGEVIDQNDIAVLRLSENAPEFAPVYRLSSISDLTGVNHEVAGYGVRSDTGGSIGSNLGTGRLRSADNRFDFRFGDADFAGYWTGVFGNANVDNVWISDFDNGTAFRDGSCNVGIFEGFSNAVFQSSKYCDLGRGAREGIGGGGDSGGAYFVDGELAAVHSFGLWYRADESNNRFGQLKGAVSVAFHRDFILASIPEPTSWAMMLSGFALVGSAIRRKQVSVSFV